MIGSTALVTTFLIDLVSSSKSTLGLCWDDRKAFFKAFAEQLEPHAEFLQLKQALIKFTGDGWLLMSSELDDQEKMCCLALILRKRFREEMSKRTDWPVDRIPRLRMSLFSAKDMQVKPFGKEDWVFESAWGASRLAQFCDQPVAGDDEILVNELLKSGVDNDFEFQPVDLSKRSPPPKQPEKEITASKLIRPKAIAGLKNPLYAYTRLLLGELSKYDAATFVHKFALDNPDWAAESLHSWLRHLVPTYGSSRKCLEMLIESGVNADVRIFTAVLSKPDNNYSDRLRDFNWMKTLRVEPNKFTYTALISKSPNFETAKQWFENIPEGQRDVAAYSALMAKAKPAKAKELFQNLPSNVQPNARTFSALIVGAASYPEARAVFKQMQERTVVPILQNYIELVGKAKTLSFEDASQLLEEVRKSGLLPKLQLFNAILNKLGSEEDRQLWSAKMREAGFDDDTSTYNILLKYTASFDKADTLLAEMRNHNIPRDVITYNTLLEVLRKRKIRPRPPTDSMSPELATFDKARQYLNEMQADKVAPDTWTFNALLVLAQDRKQAVELFDSMVKRGLRPNTFTFNQMIKFATTLAEGIEWVEKLAKSKNNPDSYTFGSLLKRKAREAALSNTEPEELVDWYLQLQLPVSSDDDFCSGAITAVLNEDSLWRALSYGERLRKELDERGRQSGGSAAI